MLKKGDMKSFSELLCQLEVRVATYEESLKGMKALYRIPFDHVTTHNLNDIFLEVELDKKRYVFLLASRAD